MEGWSFALLLDAGVVTAKLCTFPRPNFGSRSVSKHPGLRFKYFTENLMTCSGNPSPKKQVWAKFITNFFEKGKKTLKISNFSFKT